MATRQRVATTSRGSGRTAKTTTKKAVAPKPAVAPRKVAGKKAPAKKAPAKKAPAKKAPAKKAPAKKTATKKAPAKKAASKPATKKAPAKKAPAKRAAIKPATKKTATKPATKKAATKPAPKKLVVRGGERPWTPQELAEVRRTLELDAARLRGEIQHAEDELNELLRNSGEGSGDDQADAGSKTFEREQEMSMANNARDSLMQTEHALARIDVGTYGVCESCGKPVGKARLQAFPRATLCVSCKQREERR